MPETANRLLTLTAQIAAAYVGANTMEATAVPGLIRDIHRSLAGFDPVSGGVQATARPAAGRSTATPAIEIRKSVFADHLICLEDGLKVTMLKRHLRTAHNLTPERTRSEMEYRRSSYPAESAELCCRSARGWRRPPVSAGAAGPKSKPIYHSGLNGISVTIR